MRQWVIDNQKFMVKRNRNKGNSERANDRPSIYNSKWQSYYLMSSFLSILIWPNCTNRRKTTSASQEKTTLMLLIVKLWRAIVRKECTKMYCTNSFNIFIQIFVFLQIVKNALQVNHSKTNRNVNKNVYEDLSYTESYRNSENGRNRTVTENRIRNHAKIGALLLICNS